MNNSMPGQRLHKFATAQTAAQALALALRRISGETVGVRFDDAAWTVKGSADAVLFVPESSLTKGGTCFTFLPDAWRRWPEHWFILVTDGDGSVLPVLPADREHTSAVVIPDGERDTAPQIAEHVVVLNSLNELAQVMTLLIPRRSIA